jgi:DNA-directed RNA polymerase subunit H (RpoH/RPB5)
MKDLNEILKRFDALPDDAVVSSNVTATILGVCSKTVREHPHLKKVWVSANRYGQRVGDIRKIVRDRTLSREVGAS